MTWTANTTGGYVIEQGLLPVKITLTDTCNVGDLIGYDAVSSNVWERADADAKVYANLVAGEKCTASGNTIQCYKMAVISGFSGGTATVGGGAGHNLWLSNTAGAYAAEPVGNYHQCVGQMISDTTAVIRPDAIPQHGFASETYSTGLGEAAFFRAQLFNGVSASMFGGVKIECQVETTADTITSARSLYIYHNTKADTTAADDNVIVRLEDGSNASYEPYAFIQFVPGNATGPDYFFHAMTQCSACISTSGALSLTQSGWFKCNVAGSTRYIALYSA